MNVKKIGRAGSWGAALAAAVMVAGCSGGPGPSTKKGVAAPSPSASASSPSASSSPSAPTFVVDPKRTPKTAAQGEALARTTVLKGEDWGPGFVGQDPAESVPKTMPVLSEACEWRRVPLPRGVLASTSRYGMLPAQAGKGTVKVTAVVTVHSSVTGADQQLATTLEEVLRCPEQRLGSRERITKLISAGQPFGARGQGYADDAVYEFGEYAVEGGRAYPYRWSVVRVGPLTVAVSVKGAQGYTEGELDGWSQAAISKVLSRVTQQLGGTR